MKKLFICFIFSSALLIAGCRESINDSSDPEAFITTYLKNLNTLPAEKLARFFSKKSLAYENSSEEEALKASKKLVNDMKFAESEIEDVKIDDVYNYNKDTVITYVTYKLKIGSKNDPEIIHDIFVLSKENNRWKINFKVTAHAPTARRLAAPTARSSSELFSC